MQICAPFVFLLSFNCNCGISTNSNIVSPKYKYSILRLLRLKKRPIELLKTSRIYLYLVTFV